MKFIDTHIHLQDFKSINATDIIKDALDKGINRMVCAAIQQKDWEFIADLYEQYPNIIVPAFGIHPWYVKEVTADWAEKLEVLLNKYPKALVGETGLDRHRTPDEEPQNELFKVHIDLAKKYDRPILIHAVKSQDWMENYWKILPKKFVIHSYNGRRELLKKILSHGGLVSYSSAILSNREKDKTLRATPLDKMMLETDAPYQGSYHDIINTAKEVAELCGVSLGEFAAKVYKNSEEFIDV